ncbi:MAG: hypothetical protein ACTSXA_06010 [Candidatus Heimdallarchaeota archaeon]
MSSESENDKDPHPLFESRFFSVILMLALMSMNIIFIVVIQQFYGTDPALKVLMYLGIGSAGGVVLTFIILGVSSKKNASKGRNMLLYMTAAILFISLIISVILLFTIQDEIASRNAFVNSNSVGLGITTGIAVTYSILTLAKSKLIFDSPEKEQEESKVEVYVNPSEET